MSDVSEPPDLPHRPTIYDVANRAGVSKSLVSLVLRDSPRVSPARREAVLAAITELGYRPSQAATALASHRTKSIEVLIDDYRNLWFVGLVHGMQAQMSAHGYYLTVTESRSNAELGQDGRTRPANHVDGLVIAAEPEPGLNPLVPTVVAGWRDNLPAGVDLVANDDEAGGRLAAEHLIALGHTEIGHLTGSGGAALHRRSGFAGALAVAGLVATVTGDGGTAEDDGYAAAVALFKERPGITAVFAANDTMALGALAAIRQRGLSVPQDVSLVGYDNSPLAMSRYLDLTSVDARNEAVGDAAARALLQRIENPAMAPRHTLIEPSLVVRSTTAARC